MSPPLRSLRKILHYFGVVVTRSENMKGLILAQQELERAKSFNSFLSSLAPDAMRTALELFPGSRGENFQDIFALLILGEQRHGYFVEFGATDGVRGSNTFYMEKALDWSGLLVEPARCWHESLTKNRNVCISKKCVWRESGLHLPFRETTDAGYSTLDFLAGIDRHRTKRVSAGVYEVETVTLNEILTEHGAPRIISYLSVDTEGSEFAILECFDFETHRPMVVTVEHNFRPDRKRIVELMAKHGYVRAPASVSKYDDWFVYESLADRLPVVFTNQSLQEA